MKIPVEFKDGFTNLEMTIWNIYKKSTAYLSKDAWNYILQSWIDGDVALLIEKELLDEIPMIKF
jgi:hypothetical protein